MGFFDNVRDRLSGGRSDNRRGRGRNNYDDYDNEYYDEGSYDDRELYDARYGDDYRDDYEDNDYERPASMNRFGVDRADYYNDNHAPLVSLADVRAQPIPLSTAPGRVRERSTGAESASSVYGQSSRGIPRTTVPRLQSQQGDELAFKDGLARTEGSFSQLQEQRLRMETTGRMEDMDASRAQGGGAAMAGIDQSALAAPISLQDRISAGQVHQRVHRRIEHISPTTYAEAEQVSQELKQGIVVVLDLRSTRPELAKRILDFSFGVVSALDGQVERHIDRVYIFTRNGALSESEQDAIRV
jgi:cell division inhibitor SepF